MSDIRTRPSVGKRSGNQMQSFVEIRERTRSHISKLAEDCQRIVSVRKDSKNIEESGVVYVRKVKHRSQSYSPAKERKKYHYPKFQYRQTSNNQKNKHPALATAVENYIGPRTVPIVQKKTVKTAINSDIRAHSVETEK